MPSWVKKSTTTVDGYNQVEFDTQSLSPWAFVKTSSGTHITLTFDGNGGNGFCSPIKTLPDTVVTLPENPYTKAWSTFDGWLIDGESEVRVPGDTYEALTDKTIRAQWSGVPIPKHTVTYKAGDGSGNDYVVSNIDEGTKHSLVAFTTTSFVAPSGKQFDKWAEGTASGTKYSEGASVTVNADMVFIATYKDIPVYYSVTYKAGEGSGNDYVVSNIEAGTNHNLVTFATTSFVAPSHKTFTKWALGDASGTQYSEGDSYTVSANTTFVALYQSDPQVTITFDANGGSGTMTPETIYVGESYVLPSNGFTAPSGKEFKNWIIGSGQYEVGDTIYPTEDTEIKANWKDSELKWKDNNKSTWTEANAEGWYGRGAQISKFSATIDASSTYNIPAMVSNVSITSVAGLTGKAFCKIGCTGLRSLSTAVLKTCTSLTEVSFPNCKYIAPSAFSGCTQLSSVYFPVCESIGSNAFYGCTSLLNIELSSCSYVYNTAFANCTSLASVSLVNCKAISAGAFQGCLELDSVFLPNCSFVGNLAFKSTIISNWDGLENSYFTQESDGLIEKSTSTLVMFTPVTSRSHYEMSMVKILPSYAFCSGVTTSVRSGITSVDFPNCTTIGSSAFAWCTGITSVDFPNCSIINPYAFASCTNLESVIVDKCSSIGAGAFCNDTKLTKVSFPSCTFFGASALQNCTNVTEVSLPLCQQIGSFAFNTCNKLSSLNLPECTKIGSNIMASYSMTNISFPVLAATPASLCKGFTKLTSAYLPLCTNLSSWTFSGCTSLSNLILSNCVSFGNGALSGCTKLTELSFPSCTTIGQDTFYGCYNVSSAYLPLCTNIPERAFSGCASLASIYAPSVTHIGYFAFGNCRKLTDVEFNSCLSIDTYAFSNCSLLTKASFPSCQSVMGNVFANCSSLTEVYFPALVSTSESVFLNCSKLSYVELPACETIATSTFHRCVGLQAVSLPVCSCINWAAFSECTSMTSLYLLSTSVVQGSYSMFTRAKLSAIYVPESLIDSYQSASYWSVYASRFVAYTE